MPYIIIHQNKYDDISSLFLYRKKNKKIRWTQNHMLATNFTKLEEAENVKLKAKSNNLLILDTKSKTLVEILKKNEEIKCAIAQEEAEEWAGMDYLSECGDRDEHFNRWI